MSAPELQALLREIKNVRSPIQRMKLISLAWRTVQRLTPDERKELASTLGVAGFEGILQKLGRRGGDGIAPAEVLRALDDAQGDHPEKLESLLSRARDPGQRKELLRQGLDFLSSRLAESDHAQAEAQPQATSPAEEAPAPASPAKPVTPSEPVAEATPPDEIAADSGPDEVERDEPKEAVAAPQPVASGPVEAVAPEALPPETPADQAKGVRRPAPLEVAVPVAGTVAPSTAWTIPDFLSTAHEKEGEARPTADDRDVPPTGVTARIAGVPTTIARFRNLRRELDGPERFEISDLRGILACFPDGWARRRALTALIRDGQPEDLDDAMSLIDDLERPTDRRWCAAALIDARALDERQTERVLERFPFPSLARRVRRRVAAIPA